MQHATAVRELGALIGLKAVECIVDRAHSRRVHKFGPYHGDARLVLVFGAMVLEIMGCHCWPRTRFGRVEE